MRKNVSIGKRFASGVSPSPRVEQKSCTVDGWPKRIIIVVSLGYRIFLFHSRVTHPLFPLSFAVKLHFKHVYRFFFAHTWRIPRWNNIFQRWHAWCSPVNYRFPFFLGRNRATFRSFVSHFLFRIVNERCMRNLRPRSIFDLDISVINIRTAISLPVEWRKNDENREEYEKLLVRKFVCRNIEDRCWLYFCNDDGGFQWRGTFENVLKRLSWFFSERRGWALRIFSNIFVEVLVKKLATIRKMVSMDIGPFILENIDARISWLMINVWWMFFYAFMFRLFFESVSFIASNEYALFCDFYFKRKDREEMALLHIFAMVIQYTEDILEIFYFRGKKLEKRGRIGEAEWYFIRWKVSQSRHK